MGGSVTLCESVSRPIEVSRAEAAALGFEMDDIDAWFAREVQASLAFGANPDASEAPTGYAQGTELRADFEVSKIWHVRPDPKFCEDGVCSDDSAEEFAEADCPHRLSFDVSVDFEAADASFRGSADGDASIWAEGYAEQVGEDAATQLTLHAYADLASLEGTLVLPPPPLNEAGWSETYWGEMLFEAQLSEVGSEGYVGFTYLSVDPASSRLQGVRFTPLSARWGVASDEEQGAIEVVSE